VITDLRSTNGVEVRGQRIRTTAPLAEGDRVRIGNMDFVFEVRPS
jgi:pSer/pThr/pTyr-binding forkhead associated (FHA) protein